MNGRNRLLMLHESDGAGGVAVDLGQMVILLKEYEGFCYRIAYYLLRQESRACAATRQALLELAQSSSFRTDSSAERQVLAKRLVIKHALASGFSSGVTAGHH
jgi:hypothetical protein